MYKNYMQDTTLPPNLKLKKTTKVHNSGKVYPILMFEPEEESEIITKPGNC